MANVKIVDLTAATSVASADLFEIETAGGASRKATMSLLKAAAAFGPTVTRADTSIYYNPLAIGAISPLAVSANVLVAYPLFIARAVSITKLGFQVTTLASGNARVGLYNDVNGQPGTLVVESGALSVSTTGVKEATVASTPLVPGLYWIAFVTDVAPSVNCHAATNVVPVIGRDTSRNIISGLSRSFTYAAMPSDETAQTYANSTAAMLSLWCRT